MSILEILYNGQYQPEEPKTPEYWSLRKKEAQFWEEIEQSMGTKFLESHWDHQVEMEDLFCYHYFQEGFRLGASLMLEILTPRSDPHSTLF